MTASTAKERLDGLYYALSGTEQGIVDNWIKGGMPRQSAVDMIYRDLNKTAEKEEKDK